MNPLRECEYSISAIQYRNTKVQFVIVMQSVAAMIHKQSLIRITHPVFDQSLSI